MATLVVQTLEALWAHFPTFLRWREFLVQITDSFKLAFQLEQVCVGVICRW